MADPVSKMPQCPRCGSTKVGLRGQSVVYRPQDRPGQPLKEREVQTLAYQCECGLGFTQTVVQGANHTG
jgi:hypothetical protein